MAWEEEFRTSQGQVVSPASVPTAYALDLKFAAGLSPSQKLACKSAARRWSRIVTGQLPPVAVSGANITGLVVFVRAASLDDPNTLASAIPGTLRQETMLPGSAHLTLDADDLAGLEASGRLEDVVAHEIGHCLGLGTIWEARGLVSDARGQNPQFTGGRASIVYGAMLNGGPKPVPLENVGGTGRSDVHWRESIFGVEIMTTSIPSRGNPISRLTVAALADLGYSVNSQAAEPYVLQPANAADAGLPSGWESLSGWSASPTG